MSLYASLDRALRQFATNVAGPPLNIDTLNWQAPPEDVYESFSTSSGPNTLFIVRKLQDSGEDESSPFMVDDKLSDPPFSTVIAVLKVSGSLNLDENLSGQLFPLTIPISSDITAAEALHSVVRSVVSPFFEAAGAASSTAGASAIVATARQKIAELERSFVNLAHHAEIQVPQLEINPLVSETDLETEADAATLNSLQRTVNEWKKAIRVVTHSSRDPATGSSSDEILFWNSMENALAHVQTQLDSEPIKRTLAILEKGKRFHATVSFLGDTGLAEAVELVAKYQVLLREIPLNDLFTAQDLPSVGLALDAIFAHINKRLRSSSYPVWRAIVLVEAISDDFATVIRTILQKFDVMKLSLSQYRAYVSDLRAAFVRWDDHSRDFTNMARDVIRKRSEKFIPVRITPRHGALQERVEYILSFRTKHEKLLNALEGVIHNDAELHRMNPLADLTAAYSRLALVDVLDTSTDGAKEWNAAESIYSEAALSAETSISRVLRTRLAAAHSGHEMFRTFGQFNKLLDRPAIRAAIQEYQARLIQTVKEELSELQKRTSEHYMSSTAYELSKLRDIPTVSGWVIWLQQIDSRLDTLLRRVESILGPEWQFYADGKELFTESEEFRAKIDPKTIVTEWIASMSHKLPTLDGPVFSVNKKKRFVVNFDNQTLALFKEVRALVSLKFHVPHPILTLANESKKIYPFAVRLVEAINVLYDNEELISKHGDVRVLVQKYLNSVYGLIDQGLKLTWADFLAMSDTTAAYVSAIDTTVAALETRTTRAIAIDNEIKDVLDKIDSAEFNRFCFDEQVASIRGLLQFGVGYSNTNTYIERVTDDIKTRLSARCVAELKLWSDRLRDQRSEQLTKEHVLTLNNQTIVLLPSLEQSQDDLFQELLSITSQISVSGLNGPDSQLGVSTSVVEMIADISSEISTLFSSANMYVSNWYDFQGLWDLKPGTVYENLGQDLENWLNVLVDMHKTRSTFEHGQKFKKFGRVSINFDQIHSYINAKYDAWQNEIVEKFAAVVSSKSLDLIQVLSKTKKELEASSFVPQDTEILLNNISILTNAKQTVVQWNNDIEGLKRSQAVLVRYRYKFPHNWIYADHITGEWQALQSVLAIRNDDFIRGKEHLIADFEQSMKHLEHVTSSLYDQWQSSKPVSGSIKPSDALFALDKFSSTLKRHLKLRDLLQTAADNFDAVFVLSIPIDEMDQEVSDFTAVWRSVSASWSSLEELEEQEWQSLVLRKLRASLNKLLEEAQAMPARTRQYVAFQHLQNVIRQRLNSLSTLGDIHAEGFKQRHWDKLYDVLGNGNRRSINSLTLGAVWSLDLVANKAIIQEQVDIAQGEERLEKYLEDISKFWESFSLELVSYRDKLRLIRNWDEIFEKADEHLQSLATMHHSPYFPVFEKLAMEWEAKLNRIKTLFNDWIDVQRQWTYLEGIFTSSKLSGVLAMETTKFHSINSEFMAIFRLVYKNSEVLAVSNIPNILESMNRLSEQLSKLQKSLGDYFERERRRFPRFHFLGDDDLLEILGNSTLPDIEKHIRKMFSGCESFVRDHTEGSENNSASNFHVAGVRSPEGEELLFTEPVDAANVVELLEEVERQTVAALKREVAEGISSFADAWQESNMFIEWLKRPSQAAIVVSRIFWTSKLISSSDVSERTQTVEQYSTILSSLANYVLGNLSVLERRRVEAAITELVHQQHILETMKNDFDVAKQLRYYWNDDQTIRVAQVESNFTYGFEYQGVTSGLVATPLVDDMFLAMTQALDQRLGGSPFGPAGTGKTESVKALGHALGKAVVVFNCDDSFDFQAVTRILMGICQTGSWACFDELNRLESQILSSVSMQISIIEQALRNEVDTVELLGQNSVLNSQAALFVTLNPEYAGRNALPDNMKELFRGFAMNAPDKENIVEVMLYAQGFTLAKELSTILVPFFESLSNQLSPQKHYDWGLRALKSVLKICGTLKRQFTDRDEFSLVKTACHETIAPKLILHDSAIYNEIEAQAFPQELLSSSGDNVESALRQTASENGLVLSHEWLEKMLQLYRFLSIHHGIMLVGPTATGKTATYKTLAASMPIATEIYLIDAKVMAKEFLFGSLDSTTREWTDGVFTQTLRRITENLRGESRKQHWIVFDGEIDPEWAENLNSVLDDNRLLTLPNGERIPLPGNVRILFEVSSLDAATPATVSRCGMIWFGTDIVSHSMIAQKNLASFLAYVPEDVDMRMFGLASKALEKSFQELDLDLINTYVSNLDHIMEFSPSRALSTLFSYLKANCSNLSEAALEFVPRVLLLGLIWSFSGDCTSEERTVFGHWLVDNVPIFEQATSELSGEIIEYYVSTISGQWISWFDSIPQVDLEAHEVVNADMIIPTADTARHESLIYQLLSSHQPVILCGPPGSGKTMTLLSALRRSDSMDMVGLNFSKTATPELVIRTLEQRCIYSRTVDGLVLEPSQIGRWLVLFCDEINLPAQDKYGDQNVISLLRGMIEQGGFWKNTQWVKLQRIQFVGACNPSTDVGRIPLSPRFLRHCALVYVGCPEQKSLTHIYERMCHGLLKTVPALRGNADLLANAMIDLYIESQKKLNERSSYYIYSPRELTRWCRGIYEALKDQYSMDLTGLVRLWAHEALRLFSDRLQDEEDQRWTWDLIKTTAQKYFPHCDINKALSRPMLYSSWLSKFYSEVSRDELRDFLDARIRVFSEEVMETSLTLFDDLLEHTLRIDRVLRQPLGHLILMGSSSSGKNTLTRFVCWMNGISVYQLRTSNHYSDEDFASDLRHVLKRVGTQGEELCFILDESNLTESSFIERMNTLLANSEVPGLFENEEYTSLLTACKEGSNRQGLNLSDDDDLMRWFTAQITKNLHVVFTISSPDSEVASTTATSPALLNRCVLNWMGNWSPSVLAQFVNAQLNFLDLGQVSQDAVADIFVAIHDSVVSAAGDTQLKVSPGEFMSFTSQFKKVYESKKAYLEDEQRHFHVGSTKLKSTILEVDQLRSQLAIKQEQLTTKDNEAKLMLQQMLTDQSEAERKREAGINIRQALEQQNIEIQKRQEVVYKDLELAEPAVLAAQTQVSNIKKQHLTELRAFINPPEAVKITLEAVCVLLGQKTSSWREVLQAVRSEEFIPNIVNFDNERQMTTQVLNTLQNKYMTLPNFNYESVNRASKASGPLLAWVLAQVAYATVLSRVEPLKQEVFVLEQTAREKQAQEQAVNELIEELEQSIEGYKVNYATLIAETQSIKAEMSHVTSKIERSNNLISSLDSERGRWSTSVKNFQSKVSVLVGDCLLAAGFLAYCGFFDQRVRAKLMTEWTQLLAKEEVDYTVSLNISSYLSTGEDRLRWRDNGLPTDALSMDNQVILKHYDKFPLIIDPTGQAKDYLVSEFGQKKLVVTSFLDSSFPKHLESSLRFGTPLVIENAENLDPLIMPLLKREYTKRGGRTLIEFARDEVDVSKNHSLFLLTKNPKVHLFPHITSRTTLVNFSITRNSLELITLDEALAALRPELEVKRRELLKIQGEYRVRLLNLEESLLEALNSSEGEILDNDVIMQRLETLKNEAGQVAIKAEEADEAIVEVNKALEQFEPISTHSGKLFALLDSLWHLNTAYQFSLTFFLDIFRTVIVQSADPSDIVKKLYLETHKKVAPALLLSDRHILVASLIALSSNWSFDDSNFNEVFKNPSPDYLKNLYSLAANSFGQQLNGTSTDDEWYQVLKEGRNFMPCLFSMAGLDPTLRLLSLAERSNKSCRVIALGSLEAQKEAKLAIETAAKFGQWVLIQNLHMASSWMNELTQLIQGLQNSHPEMRVLFTSQMGSPNVPITVLRLCQLLTVERPAGIKAGLNECLSIIGNKSELPPYERSRVYLSLSWIHSVVQERLLIPGGWAKPYEFSDADLKSALHAIDKLLSRFSQRENVDPASIPWYPIRYILFATVYGAKIDKDEDKKSLLQIIDHVLTPAIFDLNFELTKGIQDTTSPESTDTKTLLQWVENLPESDSPTWLGLDESTQASRLRIEQDLLTSRGAKLMQQLAN